VLILAIFLTTTVSAGIYFSQPEEAYNLGDIIKSNITIEPAEEGFLTITLNCDEDSMQISPASNRDGKVVIEFPLTTAWIENMTGDCYFLAEYSNRINGKSRGFQISKRIDVILAIDSLFAKPGEEITITGYAKRLNGIGINGEVEITIPLLKLINQEEVEIIKDENQTTNQTEESNETETQEETTEIDPSIDNGIFYGQIKEGEFTVTFNLPNNIPAGDYRIDALAYEEQEGEKTSEGISTANLKIFQVPKTIDIALSNQNINPGEALDFKPVLKDQTESSILKDISVVIVNEDSKRIFERILPSEETVNYQIPSNQSAGYYDIIASSEELIATKKFYVNEKAMIFLVLENGTLVVKNIGNIPYKKDIQIELNGKPFVKKVDLKLGESDEFKLTGSNQDYNVKISDGETELEQQGVALTGHAIGVEDVKRSASLSAKPIIWIFFIIILGAGILFLLRNVIKKKSFAYPFKKKFKSNDYKTLENKEQKIVHNKKQIAPLTPPNQAEQVLVLKGEKVKAAAVVLKIKNKISKFSKQSLERAIEPTYEKRGAVYEQGDYIFIIFSPLMTKTLKNEVLAARAAQKIQTVLEEHNKKFKDKIEFGLSVNSGDIINKVENKKLKFTALGKLITSAKRLAELSDKQILVTKEAYERGISEIKAEKKRINNGDVYELRSVIDSEKNQKFLKGFLNRMEKDK